MHALTQTGRFIWICDLLRGFLLGTLVILLVTNFVPIFGSDDHDVLKFSTYSLRSPEMALVPDNVNEADSKKFEAEFDEYQKKLKLQKEEWVEKNPDQVMVDFLTWSDCKQIQ